MLTANIVAEAFASHYHLAQLSNVAILFWTDFMKYLYNTSLYIFFQYSKQEVAREKTWNWGKSYTINCNATPQRLHIILFFLYLLSIHFKLQEIEQVGSIFNWKLSHWPEPQVQQQQFMTIPNSWFWRYCVNVLRFHQFPQLYHVGKKQIYLWLRWWNKFSVKWLFKVTKGTKETEMKDKIKNR